MKNKLKNLTSNWVNECSKFQIKERVDFLVKKWCKSPQKSSKRNFDRKTEYFTIDYVEIILELKCGFYMRRSQKLYMD